LSRENQVVVVSGGSKGLGSAVVDDVLSTGGVVATFSRSTTPFIEELIAREPKRFLWQAIDGTDFPKIKKFARDVGRRFGKIDAVVNNAACITEGLLQFTSDAQIRQMVALNLEATIHLTSSCTRAMLKQRSGSVVNISSLNARRGHSGVAVYSATKAGIEGFSRALARELGPRGIRVNVVAPGYFESDMTSMLGESQKASIQRRTPLGRLGTIGEMLAGIRFFLSDESKFVTGQSLVIDGGITC